MKRLVLLSGLMSIVLWLSAASSLRVKLYPDGVPSVNGLEDVPESITEKGYYTNVSDPELLVYLPDKAVATGQAMLVVPGGSYRNVCTPFEGEKTAAWLNANGIAAMVLKYRMPNGHPDIPLEDGVRAMRLIRERAAEWNIDAANVGVMGFSAGGHFVSNLITRYPDGSARPSCAVLVYPVISMNYSNARTRENLLGAKSDDAAMRKAYSTHENVHKDVPETMLLLCDNDRMVKPDNSIRFYKALKACGVKAEMHIFPSGGHGFWMKDRFEYADEAYPLVMRWIKQHDLSTETK